LRDQAENFDQSGQKSRAIEQREASWSAVLRAALDFEPSAPDHHPPLSNNPPLAPPNSSIVFINTHGDFIN